MRQVCVRRDWLKVSVDRTRCRRESAYTASVMAGCIDLLLWSRRDVQSFVYSAHPSRVIFGQGTLAQISDEVSRLGLSRVLVVVTPQQERDGRRLANGFGGRSAGVFA